VIHPGCSYNTLFQNEWLEVSILPHTALEEGEGEQGAGRFFLPTSGDSPERRREPISPFAPITIVEDWRDQTGWSKQGWGQQSGESGLPCCRLRQFAGTPRVALARCLCVRVCVCV